jgi:hypothetical protein
MDNSEALLRKTSAVIVALFVVLIIGMSILFPRKPIPIDRANGTYTNSRCGTVTFRNGVLTSGKIKATYTLDTDKRLFALPDRLVGVTISASKCELAEDPSRNVLKLPFDDTDQPRAVVFWDIDRVESHTFVRVRRR